MSKYILEIEGDFEKGECYKCPIFTESCVLCDECPLKEVKQGEWIDNIVERLKAVTESVYNEMKGDYFEYVKTVDAIEIVKGGK